MTPRYIDTLTRSDMMARAVHFANATFSDCIHTTADDLAALQAQDVQVASAIELRELYFDTLQQLDQLGNVHNKAATEHDAEVEHPVYTKDYWVPHRRLNNITVGYWEWVLWSVKRGG